MKIAILGATSQIAKDLLRCWLTNETEHQLSLYGRKPELINTWLVKEGFSGRHTSKNLNKFSITEQKYDAVINFIGVGDPAKAKEISSSLLDVTRLYDDMVLVYLDKNPECRYLFLSSGAVYGDVFKEPVDEHSGSTIPINNITSANFYTMSKLYAEVKHRARQDLSIVDIRVFNIFSHTQDLNARFFITDIIRAITNKTVLEVSNGDMTRDFIHPSDFCRLIDIILTSKPCNYAVDCFSKAPIDKWELLIKMRERYGLEWSTVDGNVINATGNKENYFSLNKKARELGYYPKFDSLSCIFSEVDKILLIDGKV